MNTPNLFTPERDNFFDDLVTMLVSLSCYMFTMHISMMSNKPVPFEKRPLEEWLSYIAPIKTIAFPLTLDCRAESHNLVFFPTMLLMSLALNSWPQFIEYALAPQVITQPDYRLDKQGNKNIVSHIVGASFTSYYSKCEPGIKNLFGTDQDKWPEPIRIAWILRNGFAHGGKINITNPLLRPATWKIWMIDNSYNGRYCLFDDGMFGIGDVVALIQEVDVLVFHGKD